MDQGNLSVFRQPKSIEIPRAHNFAELLKHPPADLQTQRNNLINWQAGTSCMFAASLAVGRFELAEGMFAVNGKMASNPLKARHLATDCVTLEMGKLFREAQAKVKLSADILD